MSSAIVKRFCMVLWLVAKVSPSPQDESLELNKRDLWQLADIMRRCTGRSEWDYNNYGCYCGKGGSGTPVDGVDRCCKTHDECYSATSCMPSHLANYNYNCNGCSCTCTDLPNTCPYQACRCDVEFGQCLSRASYNPANKNNCDK
ncbi:hypothetical protein Btru_037291 [Bulinus truncatus]|nr:hypothetical protein Btru_037291 [Bulinus truncatus]